MKKKKKTHPQTLEFLKFLRNTHSCRKELPISLICNRFQNLDLDCELSLGRICGREW